MKIKADWDTCQGLGMCESLAPEHFEVGDDGNLQILQEDVAEADLDDVREAVAACPTAALRLE